MIPTDRNWPIAQAVELACILEASAPKAGNVHPNASFADMHFGHFVASAVAVAPVFELCESKSVGQLVLEAVGATNDKVGRNTNLGTLLLLAPLAIASAKASLACGPLSAKELSQSVSIILRSLKPDDSRDVYAAIRLARPGGLGEQTENDIRSDAPDDLIAAMRQVAQHDAVARQYVNGYADIFERLLPWLRQELENARDPIAAIVRLQMRALAYEPDGLIVRKLGFEQAQHIQQRATGVWNSMRDSYDHWPSDFERFDQYLRENGNIRNPGTTADLIATTLFCQLVCRGDTSAK